MTPDDISQIQTDIGLSDGKLATELGVTRQTFRNWGTGKPIPLFVQNSLRWLVELRRLDAANDNLPEAIKAKRNEA